MKNGKINLGLDGLSASGLWYVFINAWKQSDEFEVTSSIGSNKQSMFPPNTANSAWFDSITGQAYLDANGDLVNPLPADAVSLIRRFETHSSNILTEYTGRYGEEWVLKFDGTASTVTSGLTNAVRIGNRITGTWPANQSNKQISFTAIDHNDPPRNIRFCPVAWESLLDGGEIFNPDWLAEVSRGSGIIRFMDWQVTNKNRSTRTFAEIPTESFYIYGGANSSSDDGATYLKGGMPLSVITSLAEQAESHAWVCIPHVFGTPKTAKVTGITQANPPVVTSANHPFVNGDQVISYLISGMTQASTVTLTIASPCVVTWTSHPLQANNAILLTGGTLPTGLTIGNAVYVKDLLSVDTFTVSATPGGAAINTSGSQSGTHTGTTGISRNTFTVASATTNTFELSGVNSSGFSAFSSSGWLTSPYSLSGMTTEVTLFATHFRDNMPDDFFTYFEFSNEAWNSIFDAFHWLAAQARAKFANDNSYKMTGFLLAHCMKTVRDVYGVNSRTRWKGVLATITNAAGPTVTNDIVAGVNQYISEEAPTLTINDLLDAMAVTNYWGGNLISAHASISQAWLDDSITRFNSGLEPTKYAYFNRLLNEDLLDARHTGITFSVEGTQTFWPALKAIADANGLAFIAYEGGNSNALNDGVGLTNDADWREFFPQSTQTNEDAANYTAMFQAFEGVGGTYPAKFTEANPVNIFGSFGALRYPGDSNPTWDAVVEYNQPTGAIPWIRGGQPGSGGWGGGTGYPLSRIRKLSELYPIEDEPDEIVILTPAEVAAVTAKPENPAEIEMRNRVLRQAVQRYRDDQIEQDDEEVMLLQ